MLVWLVGGRVEAWVGDASGAHLLVAFIFFLYRLRGHSGRHPSHILCNEEIRLVLLNRLLVVLLSRCVLLTNLVLLLL